MPSRYIREEYLTSKRVNELDAASERFYFRLMLVADDQGRYFADATLLRSSLFPRKDDVRSTDIPRWITACEKSGLIRCYKVGGEDYLLIERFNQRERSPSKFPDPPNGSGNEGVEPADSPPSNDSSPPSNDSRCRPSTNANANANANARARESVRARGMDLAAGGEEVPDEERALSMVDALGLGIPAEFSKLCYADWADNNGCNAKNVPKPWLAYVRGRWRYEQTDWRSGKHRGLAAKKNAPRIGPSMAEVQAYCEEKFADSEEMYKAIAYAASWYRHWSREEISWKRRGVLIDWKVEFSQSWANYKARKEGVDK